MPVVIASYNLEWKPAGSWVALAVGNVTSLEAGTQAALGDNGVVRPARSMDELRQGATRIRGFLQGLGAA